jgi:hypothetical protein
MWVCGGVSLSIETACGYDSSSDVAAARQAVSFSKKRTREVSMSAKGLVLRDAISVWGKNAYGKMQYFAKDKARAQQSVERSFEQYYALANQLRGVYGMAKKEFKSSDWKGFVDVKLTDEHRLQLDVWDIHDGDIFDGLATYGEGGYKFSLTYQKQQDSWVATYTGQDTAGKNAGYSVTAYAPTPYDAMRTLLFKVTVILPENWHDYTPDTKSLIG